MNEQHTTAWPDVIMGISFGLGFLILVTIIVVVCIRAFVSTKQASAALARDDAYRKLAENYDAHLTRAATNERDMRDELAFIRGRVEAMEQLLRSVD
ncbi:hypothetical protein GCM10010123_11860 [Pilimelia anulata]|uniref:Uncharacterized protein n=1 Tax=Pilimelia anulata TaxID=53371 RepID=A0A8J3B5D0_9ACTN|nr:hypothetical protein [Pilimelia anulata]GGJ83793.1 hypothetical protein GCM10010123_11860 [Pilimelia anulata]